MKKLPRGIRNQNPGNIEWGDPWQGLIPVNDRTDPRFCQFESPVFGIRAIARVLITYQDKRLARDGSRIDTVREVIERWAPAHENDVNAYVRAVRSAMFGSPSAPQQTLDVHRYEHIRPLIEAIIRHENGAGPLKNANTWYDDAVIEEGLRLAGVRREQGKAPITKETIGASATGAVGVVEIADALPAVVAAIKGSEDHLLSGQAVRVALGVVLVAAAALIAYGQIKKHQTGAL